MKVAKKKQEPTKTDVTERRPRGRRVGSRQNPFAKRVDVHVGERLRERRSFMGYTQESLAQELVLSHQQVQKYETGANRISAGRLYELGKTLDVPIQYFFEGFDESLPAHTPKHGGTNRAAIEIAQNFSDITDQTVRSTLSSLVKTLASHSRGD
jgi:transcriptional regulator with XRE-family HTH domain